jgi:hypothetical protein
MIYSNEEIINGAVLQFFLHKKNWNFYCIIAKSQHY